MDFLFKDLKFEIENNMGIAGLTDEFFCVYINNYFNNHDKNIYIVTSTLYEANTIYSSLSSYCDYVYLFPMDDFLTSEALSISPEFKYNRLETINNIINNEKSIIITNLDGYLRFLPRVSTYKSNIINLKKDEIIEPKSLVEKLVNTGYKKESIVTKTGEFAVRGFIVDIFPFGYDNPVRIEFFDDIIDSIRTFSSEDQKSISSIDSVEILPISEFLVVDKEFDIEKAEYQKNLSEYEECVSLYDYLDKPLVIYKDYNQIFSSYKKLVKDIIEYNKSKNDDFEGRYLFDFDEIKPSFKMYYLSINNYKNDNISKLVNFNVKTINKFNENIDSINDFLFKCINDKKIVIICLNKNQIRAVIKNLKMKIFETDFNNIHENSINIIDKEINRGFIYNNYVILSAFELFNIKDKKNKYTTKYKYAVAIKDLNKITKGDYIVHSVHGIGIYNGIKTLTFHNVVKDYIELLYQGTDKIYIPVEKIDSLYKYSGQEESKPKINKLGSSEWEKTKTRVKNKVSDIADKLLKLYAEREQRKGFAFSKDNDLSYDFESSFSYDLTIDQKKSILDIKNDMEKEIPMDRLLCGDVGFGKTEVAFVAAFKAILDSKQVLFLCPTTILSSQHYENALNRFNGYPVNIALLNRFTSAKEVTRIKNGLLDGTIDMVFGTHRLLSDDIKLKDLGLLVIDEEQRFGVVHKEKIKEMKTNVDVLTLTATPIPRTLQMSLTGLRSLSLIETPPVNRYPVQTYVIEENDHIIRDAIYKEMSRKGQVYILYNKVQSIEECRDRIQRLVPDARIGIAHGQMNKNELESTVYDFTNNNYDILLCTTIIETGIDIPNVNTLIIFDADRFGLSQLYQIRGRVGRSDKFAYAYLMYKPFKKLNPDAIKRLNVIKEFTELGSGFSIATRDLSIRGAGDILGSEQAGFIDSVGIDLYLKLLNEEVDKRNNKEVDEEEDNNNSKQLIDVSTHIDDKYVDDDDLKIEIHKKINSIDSIDTFNKVKTELEDRFGKINEDMVIYMYEEWFEKLVKKLKLSHVNQTKNSIEMVFPESVVKCMNMEEVFVDSYNVSRMFRFVSRGTNIIIVLDIIKLEKHPIYYLVELLSNIYDKYGKDIDLIK